MAEATQTISNRRRQRIYTSTVVAMQPPERRRRRTMGCANGKNCYILDGYSYASIKWRLGAGERPDVTKKNDARVGHVGSSLIGKSTLNWKFSRGF
ncbi:hypothetical protein ACS0TY_009801 [Phlomoides rotata]